MAEDDTIINAARRLRGNRDFQTILSWVTDEYADLVLAADPSDTDATRIAHYQYLTMKEFADKVEQLGADRGR